MRTLFAALVVVALLVLVPVSAQESDSPELVVHEWGVFTYDNGTLSGIIESEVPEFVIRAGQEPDQSDPEVPNMPDGPALRKPIIYLYGEGTVDVRVRVQNGEPAYYWPYAEENESELHWRVNLHDQRPREGVSEVPERDEWQWWNTARETDSAWLEALPSNNVRRGRRIPRAPNPAEKFLYYDGAQAYSAPVEAGLDEDGVTLANSGSQAIYDVFYIEVDEGVVRYTVVPFIRPESETVLAADSLESADVEELTTILGERLLAAGLYEEEAGGMARIWAHEFFGRPGRRLVYRITSNQYDALLPIVISPEPTELVRVGLIEQELD